MKKKAVKLMSILLAAALLVCASVGGTLAWLSAKTETVVNTFTVGNIDIKLEETFNAKSTGNTGDNDIWQGKMIPGSYIAKDPKITVLGGSEPCWLFVKIEEECSVTVGEDTYTFDDFLDYELDAAYWTALNTEGENYVAYAYHTAVDASMGDQSIYVLKDIAPSDGEAEFDNGCVEVLETVSKAMMDAAEAEGAIAPELSFTAYAVQSANLSVTEAWAEAKLLG